MQLEDDHPYIGQSVVEECGVRPPAAPYLLMFLLHRFTRVYDKIPLETADYHPSTTTHT